MKNFMVKSTDFAYMMAAAKLAVGKKGVFSEIYCKIIIGKEEDSLVATITDSYRLHRITIPCTIMEGSDFSLPFFLPVFPNKPNVKFPFVSIEIKDNNSVMYTINTTITTLDVIEGSYPNVDDYLPTDEPIATACVSPAYMRDAFAAFATEESVTIEMRGKLSLIMVRAKAGNFALVCPIKERE